MSQTITAPKRVLVTLKTTGGWPIPTGIKNVFLSVFGGVDGADSIGEPSSVSLHIGSNLQAYMILAGHGYNAYTGVLQRSSIPICTWYDVSESSDRIIWCVIGLGGLSGSDRAESGMVTIMYDRL